MMEKELEEIVPTFCVIPSSVLLDDKMTTQEKMDLIMANFKEQSRAANECFSSVTKGTKVKSGVQK